MYVGAKKYRALHDLGLGLENVVWFSSYGLVYWIATWLFLALAWIHDHLVANYGLAIILSTIGLRLVLYPLNQYAMVRMRKVSLQMQRIQPKIKAIQQKHKKSKDPVACMANTKRVNDHPEVTRFILERALREGVVNVFPVAAVTRGLEGKEMTDFTELAEAGAVAFSDDGKPVGSALLMRRAMEYARPFGYLIMTHSEDPELAEGGAANEGWTAQKLGLPGILAAAEEVAIAREILLARQTRGRVHIQHISTRMGVDLLRMAKRAGLAVTGETAPQHFTLTDAALEGYDTNAKMNPPLRGKEDRMAVLEAILDGTIDASQTTRQPKTGFPDKPVSFDEAVKLAKAQLAEKGIRPAS